MEQQENTYVAEVFSKQLAQKIAQKADLAVQQQAVLPPGRPLNAPHAALGPANRPASPAPLGGFVPESVAYRPVPRPGRPHTDTFFRWNALPNEYIVPIGVPAAEPILGGSVSRWDARGVLRFPSSVQRIEFRTDNISSENQGVLVEGWACWRVKEPKKAVEKLDFSDADDPMGRTNRILAIECAGIMKGLISVKSVADLLKRREDLIDRLRQKLQPTEERWGISFDEIGISEVQVLSQDVFENLQRPFRNEAREVASTSDLETEERITQKTASQRERVARIEAENQSKLRELHAKNESQIREIELTEEKRRLVAEEEVAKAKIEERMRAEGLEAKLRRDLERERIGSEQEAALAEMGSEQEKRLRHLRADEEKEVETIRLQAAREQAALETEAAVLARRKEAEIARVEAEKERAQAEAKLAAERRAAKAQATLEEAKAAAEAQRLQLALDAEREKIRLDAADRERTIQGRYSEEEIRYRLVRLLPRIAENIKVGDVRWYGGGAGKDGDGPMGILARAVDQVLDIAQAHGIDIRVGKKPEAPGAS